MKIGLLSDSHGNIKYVKKAGKYLKEKFKVGLIAHLGDECGDADALKNLNIPLIKISCLISGCCDDPQAPAIVVQEIEGIKIFLTHSPEFPLSNLPSGVKAVFYGHTHIPKIENKNNILWVNPGHLRETDKKGPASFAVVDVESGKLTANIIKYSDIV